MSGRQNKASIDATRALFAACHALDVRAVVHAFERRAATCATDDHNHRPLGVMLNAWGANRCRPAPCHFIDLLNRHGADLNQPGGEGTPHTLADDDEEV